MDFKIGCCGFSTAKQKYYRTFKVVEIQETFYQPPKMETISKWRTSAPNDFEFTLKAWQLITHEPTSPTYRRLKMKIAEKNKPHYGFFKPTDEVFAAWDKTRLIASLLKAKVIVFQCPASFFPERKNLDNLKKFFKRIKREEFIFVWEPRGNWPIPVIQRLCEEQNLVHCVDPFKSESVYGKIGYFRLHGITGYSYKYSDADIERLKNFCLEKKRRLTYTMFNNISMWQDAVRFKKL